MQEEIKKVLELHDESIIEFMKQSEEARLVVYSITLLMRMNDTQRLALLLDVENMPVLIKIYICRFLVDHRFFDQIEIIQKTLESIITKK